MKNLAKLFTLGLALVIGVTSCGNEASDKQVKTNKAETPTIDATATRGAGSIQAIDQFKLADVMDEIQIEEVKAEAIKLNMLNNSEDDDAATVMALGNDLTAAENAMKLDVQFSMSDEPIDNGIFLFNINSETDKELTLEMYDEEAFEVAARNKINVAAGKNYKGLNVNSLEAGDYVFTLRNDEGHELKRKVSVSE